jgi:hypothetical protein
VLGTTQTPDLIFSAEVICYVVFMLLYYVVMLNLFSFGLLSFAIRLKVAPCYAFLGLDISCLFVLWGRDKGQEFFTKFVCCTTFA